MRASQAPSGRTAQQAVAVDVRDDQADLVDVREQQDGRAVGGSDARVRVADDVGGGVRELPRLLAPHRCRRALRTGRAGGVEERLEACERGRVHRRRAHLLTLAAASGRVSPDRVEGAPRRRPADGARQRRGGLDDAERALLQAVVEAEARRRQVERRR